MKLSLVSHALLSPGHLMHLSCPVRREKTKQNSEVLIIGLYTLMKLWDVKKGSLPLGREGGKEGEGERDTNCGFYTGPYTEHDTN